MDHLENLCIDCECRFGGNCGECEYRTHSLLPEGFDDDIEYINFVL